MSDHKKVITDINIKVKSKSVPGKIYIYNNKKANMNVINQHLDKENIVFTNNSKTNSPIIVIYNFDVIHPVFNLLSFLLV
jgi:hypothetical protein